MRKKETQLVGYVVKDYWNKEKRKIKVNGLEKHVTMIKDLVISLMSLSQKIRALQRIARASLENNFLGLSRSPNKTPKSFFSGPTIRIGTESSFKSYIYCNNY